jgi:hypothetical protein
MRIANQSGRWWNALGVAAAVALSLTLASTPRAAHAQSTCAGDCDGSGEVTVDEIIVLVNITLETAQPSACPNGIPAGRPVDITLIIQSVGYALNACPAANAVCGNGVTESPETCDDGGTCIGSSNAGTACTADDQCPGNGICEEGTKQFFACASNADCPDGRCVRCKTFGGDGCAANCTTETDVTMTLLPGVVQGLNIKQGTSGAVVHSDLLTIPLPLSGTQVLTIGQKGSDGHVTAIIRANSIQFPRIPVSSIACACMRGIAAKTCGGTLYDIDGLTPSEDCTPGPTDGDSVCTTKGLLPCAFLHGPGNAGSGTVGCGDDGYSPVDMLFDLDSGGESGVNGDPVITLSGHGPKGSAMLLTNNTIGTVTGACTGNDTSKYGEDKALCTDDDPQDSRGDPSPQFNLTGTATGKIENANDTDGNDLGSNQKCAGAGDPDPCCTGEGTGTCGFSVTGVPLVCEDLLGASHSVTGANLAGAFVSPDQPTLADIVVTTNLVGQ